MGEAQLGGCYPVGVVVVGDEHLYPQLFCVGLKPPPKCSPIALQEHLKSDRLAAKSIDHKPDHHFLSLHLKDCLVSAHNPHPSRGRSALSQGLARFLGVSPHAHLANVHSQYPKQVRGRRTREPESVHQRRQDERPLALVLPADPAGVMTKRPTAGEALVAVDLHLCGSMVFDGLFECAVVVQDRPFAVAAASGTVGGMSVDIRHYQTYLHDLAALL